VLEGPPGGAALPFRTLEAAPARGDPVGPPTLKTFFDVEGTDNCRVCCRAGEGKLPRPDLELAKPKLGAPTSEWHTEWCIYSVRLAARISESLP
jgi:hypothetical protein